MENNVQQYFCIFTQSIMKLSNTFMWIIVNYGGIVEKIVSNRVAIRHGIGRDSGDSDAVSVTRFRAVSDVAPPLRVRTRME